MNLDEFPDVMRRVRAICTDLISKQTGHNPVDLSRKLLGPHPGGYNYDNNTYDEFYDDVERAVLIDLDRSIKVLLTRRKILRPKSIAFIIGEITVITMEAA